MSELTLKIVALDPGNGYVLKAVSEAAGERTEINEHRDTEAETLQRLSVAWNFWATRVNSE